MRVIYLFVLFVCLAAVEAEAQTPITYGSIRLGRFGKAFYRTPNGYGLSSVNCAITEDDERTYQAARSVWQLVKAIRPHTITRKKEEFLLYQVSYPIQKKIDSVKLKYAKQPDSLKKHVAALEAQRENLMLLFLTEEQRQAYAIGKVRVAEEDEKKRLAALGMLEKLEGKKKEQQAKKKSKKREDDDKEKPSSAL